MRLMSTLLLLALASAVTLALGVGCKKDGAPTGSTASPSASVTASPDAVPAGVNAVQNEMRLLHEAMRNCVTAVAYGTLDSIPESLHTVHRARELTEKALESGAYKLPRNADKQAAFEELDEQFHAELEKLVATAKSKDAAATGTEIGVVLSKCSGCHGQFKP